jgi:hypothetical protein
MIAANVTEEGKVGLPVGKPTQETQRAQRGQKIYEPRQCVTRFLRHMMDLDRVKSTIVRNAGLAAAAQRTGYRAIRRGWSA